MCTFVIFPDTPVGPVIGNCHDDAGEWVHSPDFYMDRHIRPYPANGIFETGTGGGVFDYESEPQEVFPLPDLLKNCHNIDEAEEITLRYAPFLTHPGQGGFLDLRTGETLSVERSWGDADAWRTDDGIIYDTYGGCTSPKLQKLCNMEAPLFRYYQTRMAAMKETIEQNRHQLGVETMWKVLMSHTPGGAVCQHPDTRPEGVAFTTLSVYVTAPALGRLWNRFARDGQPPCKDEPTEIQFEPWPCEYFKT